MSTSVLRNRKALVTAIAILLVGCGAWGYVSLSKDKGPAVPKDLTVAALQAKASQDPGKVFEQVHQAMDRTDLTEEQRHAVWENAHQVMEAQMDKRMDEYFAAATVAQRNAVLDRQINEMQARMKEWQARRAQRGDNDDHRPGDRGRRTTSAGGTGGASPQPGNGPAAARPGEGHGGPRHEPSRQERKAHSESRDPDKAARRMAYFAAMRQRAEERGIQMPGRGPGH